MSPIPINKGGVRPAPAEATPSPPSGGSGVLSLLDDWMKDFVARITTETVNTTLAQCEKIVDEAVSAEREACAEIADACATLYRKRSEGASSEEWRQLWTFVSEGAHVAAEAIRGRSETNRDDG